MMEDTSRAQASKEQSFLYKQVNIPLTSKNKKKDGRRDTLVFPEQKRYIVSSLVGCRCVRACHLLRTIIAFIGQIAQPMISLEKKQFVLFPW